MHKNLEIHFIREDNFETVIVHEQKPVLLLCMLRDDQFSQQINDMILENLN